MTRAQNFICANPFSENPETRAQEALVKFFDQLKRFRIVSEVSENPGSMKKATVSGKVNKEGKVSKSAHDDLAFVVSMATGVMDKLYLRAVDWFDYVRVWP